MNRVYSTKEATGRFFRRAPKRKVMKKLVYLIKFDQKKYFTLSFCYTGLYAECSMKEGTNSFLQ